MPDSTLYTIGHSRHTAEHFLVLLRAHAIERLVDVRSQPSSKWAPHFDKVNVERWLVEQRIDYVFAGRQLGGRPEGREFYRPDGTVDYAQRSAAGDFIEAVSRLAAAARYRRTTILCAEENPGSCHRRLLVAPAIARFGLKVVHVRGDGSVEHERDTGPAVSGQLDLFGGSR